MKRRSKLTPLSRRMTPNEVCQFWFRRGVGFADDLHSEYPDFPAPAPDGLYLLSQVEGWFDRFHGASVRQTDPILDREEEAAMRAARGL